MKFPNFLIIGANKGGTTSLFNYLGQHPDIFTPEIKEPMFFNYYKEQGGDGRFRTQKVIKSLDSYKKLFEGSSKYKAAGESSTSYLANPFCAENIFDFNPKMKLIAILRNPIDRAFSNYLMYVRWGDENRSFSQSLKDEITGKELPQGKQYIYLGYYVKSLKLYKELFGDKNLKILLNEDLKNEPLTTYKAICEYLNVDTNFKPDFKTKYNTNSGVEIRVFHKFLKRFDKKLKFSKVMPKAIKNYIYSKPKMKKKDKRLLFNLYKEEIMELSEFLNRDLNHWLK